MHGSHFQQTVTEILLQTEIPLHLFSSLEMKQSSCFRNSAESLLIMKAGLCSRTPFLRPCQQLTDKYIAQQVKRA